MKTLSIHQQTFLMGVLLSEHKDACLAQTGLDFMTLFTAAGGGYLFDDQYNAVSSYMRQYGR